MLTSQSRGISYLEFERLSEQPFLRHGISLRRPGGQPQSHDVELDFHNRDPKSSRQAKKHFCQALGLKPENLTEAGQTHSSHVHIVRGQAGVIRNTDGLCTNTQGLGLMQFGADCPLILVYDPKQVVLGMAHAGWRGTLQGIVERLVAAMKKEFRSKPQQLLAGIGPGICGQCYEVQSEVVEQVSRKFSDWRELIQPTDRSDVKTWRFDLIEANRRQLIRLGLTAENIEVSGFCTYERADLFYSYRRDGSETGRWAMLAGLVPAP